MVSCPSFETACTYEDLIRANLAFLEGQLNQSPYHWAPIAEETLPLLPKLAQLNRLGFVTVNGQPALDQVVFVEKTQKWCAIRQLPFLEGYMPKAWIPYLRTFLDEDQTNCVYHIYEVTDQMSCCCFMRYSDRPFVRYLEGTAPERFCVTRDKTHSLRERLNQQPWRRYTWIHWKHNDYDFSTCPLLDTVMVDQMVKVTLFSTDPSEDIEQLLLTCLTTLVEPIVDVV